MLQRLLRASGEIKVMSVMLDPGTNPAKAPVAIPNPGFQGLSAVEGMNQTVFIGIAKPAVGLPFEGILAAEGMPEVPELFMKDLKWFEELFRGILEVGVLWIAGVKTDRRTDTVIAGEIGVGNEGLSLKINRLEAVEDIIQCHMETSLMNFFLS